MLGDAGSIASLAGVAVSLVGLGFAILQLIKLRGETRAARDAAEAASRAISRELASTDITRLNGQLQALKEIHREGDRVRTLDHYPEIIQTMLDIRRRHPGLSQNHRMSILSATTRLSEMEQTIEALVVDLPGDLIREFNMTSTGFQISLLPELEDQLQQST